MNKKVAIQGIAGSYHDVAAQRYFQGETVEPVACDTFREVIEEVAAGTVGMMAIENTIAGSLLQNHELIREGGCRIVGEYKLRIMHSFAALPGTRLEDVTEVNSHPIALMNAATFWTRCRMPNSWSVTIPPAVHDGWPRNRCMVTA